MEDLSSEIFKKNAAIVIQKIYRGYSERIRTVFKLIQDNSSDWVNILTIYRIFGETLNSNDMKPMKGKIYEIFFSQKSKLFKHVDMIGYDIVCLGIKIEIKFTQNMLLTRQRNLKKTITFRCKNSNGSNEMNISNNNTAQIYILMQRDAIGYVRGKHVLKNLHGQGDLDAKIPKEYVHIIWASPNNIQINNDAEFHLPGIITDIYKCICNSVWRSLNWKTELKHCLYNIADNL